MDETPSNQQPNLPPENTLGAALFKYRDYTPIPLILMILIFAEPTVTTAVLGLISVFLGELTRVYSVAFIGSISRTRKDRTGGRLIKEGPFSFVRNPLYVGNFFITLGVAIFAGSSALVALTVALFAFQYYFIVQYEEELLRKTFGQDYDDFCREVPAWFPKKRFEIEKLEWPSSFSAAIKSEQKTLMAIAFMIGSLCLLS